MAKIILEFEVPDPLLTTEEPNIADILKVAEETILAVWNQAKEDAAVERARWN